MPRQAQQAQQQQALRGAGAKQPLTLASWNSARSMSSPARQPKPQPSNVLTHQQSLLTTHGGQLELGQVHEQLRPIRAHQNAN